MVSSYNLPINGVTTSGELEVKRSQFITFIRRVESEAQARDFIQEIKQQFPDARHHCSAFIYVPDDANNPVERSNDDGEPAGTAGKPMLEVLRGSGLRNVAAVVVRYFGGVKLGTGGLVRAYSDAVARVVRQVPRCRRERRHVWALSLAHAEAGRVEAELRGRGVGMELLEVNYGAEVTITVATAVADDAFAAQVAALTKGSVQPKRVGMSWVEIND